MTSDPFRDLYDQIAERKHESEAVGPYHGGNGRIDRAVDLIMNEEFPRSGVLLDIGGATGNLGYALRETFKRRYVVDIVEACRLPAEAKGNMFIRSNVDTDGFPSGLDNSIDLVVALDVIEHLLDPETFVDEVFRVLRPGGKVLINTPNIQFWKHLYTLVVNGVFPHTSGDGEVYHGGHVAFYNLQDMNFLFKGPRFDQQTMHTRGLQAEPPPPIWQTMAKRDLHPQLAYGDLVFSARKA